MKIDDRPYKKLKTCHYKSEKMKDYCHSKDLCTHPGWPTLCKKHCEVL